MNELIAKTKNISMRWMTLENTSTKIAWNCDVTQELGTNKCFRQRDYLSATLDVHLVLEIGDTKFKTDGTKL